MKNSENSQLTDISWKIRDTLWLDFTHDGTPYHAEVPYPRLVTWLHDNEYCEIQVQDGHLRYSRRDGGCTWVMNHMKYVDGSEDDVPEQVSYPELVERYAEHMPGFAAYAWEKLQEFIAPWAAYYEDEAEYQNDYYKAKEEEQEFLLNR